MNRFESVFENSTLGKKIITSDLKIRQANLALVHLLGYENKEALIGRNLRDFTHPSFSEQWEILRENLWDRKIPSFEVEICMIKNDGNELWCLITSILFTDDGETLGYTIVQDIDIRIKLEKEAKRLKDAQENIIYTVAHDLKNPVLLVQSLNDILKKEMLPLYNSDKQAFKKNQSLTTMIGEASTRMLSIIQDLLLVGELEKGIVIKKMTGLKEFVGSSLEMWKLHAKEKEIQIDFHPDQNVYASIDHERMGRVLDNLISNAIKFSHRDGKIEVILMQHSNKAHLQIKDYGVGIPEHLQPSVFDKFTRANRKGTSGESTTGLGLFIAKRIMELHNGSIWVDSEQNKGSTFNIELPIDS